MRPTTTSVFSSLIAISLATAAQLSFADGDQPPEDGHPLSAGLESLASQILSESGMVDRTIDCQKFYEASELWRKEKDPAKKLHAKIQLQGLLFQFYNPPGTRTFENLSALGESDFYTRMMEVLAGGELDSSELKKDAKVGHITIQVQPADWLDIAFDEEPLHFRRNNSGDVFFEFGKSEEVWQRAIALAITPVSANQFQVFAAPARDAYLDDNVLDPDSGLRGYLFQSDGNVLARFDENRAAAACFDVKGNALLVTPKPPVGGENTPEPVPWWFDVISPQGEKVWSGEIGLFPQWTCWAVWPDANKTSWNAQMVDGGLRGWFESEFMSWRVGQKPPYNSEKLSAWSFEDGEKSIPSLGHGDPVFRFTRFTSYSSYDANGKAGFRHGGNRYSSWPIWMEGYASPVDPELNRVFEQNGDPGSIATTGKNSLFLPQTSGSSLRGTWPATADFFISSDSFWPVFGHFMRDRTDQGSHRTANNDDWLPEAGEPAVFFYDKRGNFRAWTMGTVVGDAADGECLLVADSRGDLLTIAPNCDIREVREFETGGGAKAKPVLLSDKNCAGIFLVGNKLAVATWQPDR